MDWRCFYRLRVGSISISLNVYKARMIDSRRVYMKMILNKIHTVLLSIHSLKIGTIPDKIRER